MNWKRTRLRERLGWAMALGALVTVALISSVVSHKYESTVLELIAAESLAARQGLNSQGALAATTVAFAVEEALRHADADALARLIQAPTGQDPLFVYAAFVDPQSVVVVHTDAQRAGTAWEQQSGKSAGAASGGEEVTYHGKHVLDVQAPVMLAGSARGVVHLGLLLENLATTERAREQEVTDQLINLGLTCAALAVFVLLGGVLFGMTAADTLLEPLRKLHKGIQLLREGHPEFTVLPSGAPEFVEVVHDFNDMTLAVRRRESTLEGALSVANEANRYKSEYLANISHELRTPLNAILNVPGALLEDYQTIKMWKCSQCQATFEPDPAVPSHAKVEEQCPDCHIPMTLEEEVQCIGLPAEHKYLNERALKSGQHLLRLVNNLLDFSKMKAGKMELYREAVDLNGLLEDVLETVKSLAETKKIELVYEKQVGKNELQGDRVKLGQVLVNLLGNAIKFTPAGGTITVRAQPNYQDKADTSLLSVQDTGTGIPDSKLALIFEPYRQAEGEHTRAHEGSGLGLAIVKQIVELHGGKVWAESVLGKGSTFNVTLPHGVGAPALLGSPASDKKLLAADMPRRVVIIDDDAVYLDTVRSVLGRYGFEVEVARDAERAFDSVRDAAPDFVIMDIMMPKYSGFDVFRRLRNAPETRHIPVLLSSGYHANAMVAESMGAMWLPKPWQPQDLIACLTRFNIVIKMPPDDSARPIGEKQHGS